MDLDRARDEAEVTRLRHECAVVVRRLTRSRIAFVRIVEAATRRVVAQWQAVGLHASDVDDARDVEFNEALLIELKAEAQRREEGR